MRNALPRTAAELIGTFALTFFGGAAIVNGQAGLIGIALAHGLTLAVMISSVAHISGCVWPSAFWPRGHSPEPHSILPGHSARRW